MTSTSKMVQAFEAAAAVLEVKAGGPVHLIHIIGPRWSFAAGRIPKDMPFVEPQKIRIDENWALLVYPAKGKGLTEEDVKGFVQS